MNARPRRGSAVLPAACLLLFVAACEGGTVQRADAGDDPATDGPAGGIDNVDDPQPGADNGGDPPGNQPLVPSAPAAPTHSQTPAPNVSAIFETGCATAPMESQLLPSNLLFVLDRSESMACNPPPITASSECEANPIRVDDVAVNKWEIVRNSLSRAIQRLPQETNVGISYFSNDDACGVHPVPSVPLAPLSGGQASAIDASLANIRPKGATPMVGATVLAYQHMHQQALIGRLVGKKYVVLLTDGEQSEPCSDEPLCDSADSCTARLLRDEVPKAAGPGVRINTFVIGAPGSEPARNVLSEIALAGGTALEGCEPAKGNCHFDMTTQANFDAALDEALAEIAGRSALSCELPMPQVREGEVDAALVNVIYSPSNGQEPQVILQDDRMGCDTGADGWQYGEDDSKILLCGAACETALRDRGGRVDVVLGCPVERPE